MYFVNQNAGRLPRACPTFVVYRSSALFVALPKESARLSFDRDGVRHAGQRSCVLHAAGSSKIVLPTLFAWRERMRGGNHTFGDILATTRVYSPTKALGFYRHAVRGSREKKNNK